MDTNLELSNDIKAEANSLGFYACGITKAGVVDKHTADNYRDWINRGYHADMQYLTANLDKRLDPHLLIDGLKSIICVALNYAPAKRIPADQYQIAAYAYGNDYHDVIKGKLHQLAAKFNLSNYRVFSDSAPILERYWAVQSGLGWIGKNHQLIIPGAGSMFVLGELFTDIELTYDVPTPNRCGTCTACIDACPTKTLCNNIFDANKCLSYQTIENRNELSQDAIKSIGNKIYGCDECQLACPWNRFAKPNEVSELQPKEELINMTKMQWHNLTLEDYQRLFKGSAVKRAKYSGLMRNINAHKD